MNKTKNERMWIMRLSDGSVVDIFPAPQQSNSNWIGAESEERVVLSDRLMLVNGIDVNTILYRILFREERKWLGSTQNEC